MAKQLDVATRKGLFTIEGNQAAGWRIAKTAFLGNPVSMVMRDRRDHCLYAALALGHFGVKLHRSDDDGAHWQEIAAPSYPQAAEGESQEGNSLELLWALEEAGDDQPGELWAGTIPGGLFRSRDRGKSWELNEPLWNIPARSEWFGGGYEHPGIHSICVHPADSRNVVVAVSCGGIWATTDGGASWSCRAEGMRAAYMPPERANDPIIQDAHRMVQSTADPDCFWVQHHNGIFRTVDGCQSWQEITDVQPSNFGFATVVDPGDPQTAWFVPAISDECRIPVDGQVVVTRTRDGGRSFEILRHGLPQENGYDLVYRHCLDIDASGNCLALGSTSGALWISEDKGDHWFEISAHLPPINCLRFAAAVA